jgi:phospholipid-binding lipoprotein MlaA
LSFSALVPLWIIDGQSCLYDYCEFIDQLYQGEIAVNNLWNRNSLLWFIVSVFLIATSKGTVVASVMDSKVAGSAGHVKTADGQGIDLSELYMVQSSEVTINLEKCMPSQSEIDNRIASQEEGKLPSNSPEVSSTVSTAPAVESNAVAVDANQATESKVGESPAESTEMVPGTVSLAEGKEKSFEDMEDPFAETEAVIPVQKDPFEGYNRWMYSVNESIYDNFMEPVARGYRAVVHENIRLAIRNVFDNALSPVKFVSSALQGDLDKSARVLSRLVLNTTVGLGGLFDVAGDGYAVENVQEDMDQALGHWGVPTGPYLVLPFFGPSSARDFTGRIMDSMLSPTSHFSPSFLVGAGITLEERTNSVSFIIDDKKSIDDSALDKYESVRDFYHQYREGLLAK